MGLGIGSLGDAWDSATDFVGDGAKAAGDAFDDALDAAGDTAKAVGNAVSNASISDIGHTALDVAGMVPVIGEAADLANAGWYLAEGDKANAALSAAGAIPFAGNAATAAKWGKKAVDAADMVADGAKALDKAGDVAKATDNVGDAARAADKTNDAATVTGRSADEAAAAAAGRTITSKAGKNDISWKVDGQGRPVEANATIREVFPGATRSSDELAAQRSLPGKLGDDHAGHVIGHRFGLDQGVKNLFPQNGNFNTGAYKKFENEMADFVNAGAEVKTDIKLKWADDGRPSSMRVSYQAIDPKTNNVVHEARERFTNSAGQAYDRLPAKDIASKLN